VPPPPPTTTLIIGRFSYGGGARISSVSVVFATP